MKISFKFSFDGNEVIKTFTCDIEEGTLTRVTSVCAVTVHPGVSVGEGDKCPKAPGSGQNRQVLQESQQPAGQGNRMTQMLELVTRILTMLYHVKEKIFPMNVELWNLIRETETLEKF